MSTGVRKVSPEEVQKVQNLIEQCLSHYMNKNQVIDILYRKQNIEPMFTKLVWERLEEENQRFFESYHLRLIIINQIRKYNDLLQKQHALSHPVNTHGIVSNGSHIPSLNYNNGSCYVPENNGVVNKTENIHRRPPPAVVYLHGGFNNFGPFIQSEMHHGPYNMLVGPNNLNGVAANGAGYLVDSKFVYQGHGGGMESQPPVSSFGTVPNHEFNGTVIDDTRSSQLLRQFSRDISRPDSTTDFTNATDTLRFDNPRSTLGPYYSGVTDILRNFDFDQNFVKDF